MTVVQQQDVAFVNRQACECRLDRHGLEAATGVIGICSLSFPRAYPRRLATGWSARHVEDRGGSSFAVAHQELTGLRERDSDDLDAAASSSA